MRVNHEPSASMLARPEKVQGAWHAGMPKHLCFFRECVAMPRIWRSPRVRNTEGVWNLRKLKQLRRSLRERNAEGVWNLRKLKQLRRSPRVRNNEGV